MQRFFHYYTLNCWISFNLTTTQITINKCILVNDTNFTIEINTINHFLRNRQTNIKRLILRRIYILQVLNRRECDTTLEVNKLIDGLNHSENQS